MCVFVWTLSVFTGVKTGQIISPASMHTHTERHTHTYTQTDTHAHTHTHTHHCLSALSAGLQLDSGPEGHDGERGVGRGKGGG